jgi:DNA polymerase III subunit delta
VPTLDQQALRKLVSSRRLGPVHLLVGEDVRLIEQALDAIEGTIDEADRPFAVDRLYAAESGGSPIDIAATARVLPMLGDRRLVIVLRAERILKPKRSAKAAAEVVDIDDDGEDVAFDFAPLEDYLASPVPFSTLVFVATGLDRTRRFTKRLVEKAQVTEFSGLPSPMQIGKRDARSAAMSLAQEEIANAGRTIDQPALQLLADRAGNDITKLRGDLERLLLYTEGQPRITADDVDEVASVSTSVDDEWAVVNAIGDGDAARALREAAIRLDRGDSPHMMVGQLRWWVSSKLVQFRPERVRPALEALMRTDLALKSSGGDERVLMERLIVELASRRSAG